MADVSKMRLKVIARNSNGVMIIYPDGRIEGSLVISSKREQIFLEGINQMRREKISKGA